MKNIDVIGGCGFVGTRLIKRICSKKIYNIKIIDKAPGKIFSSLGVIADVRSIDQLRNSISNESIIINLAAEHKDDVRPLSLYEDVNINGAINVCKVARDKDVKTIIFTSSVAVYGFALVGTDESGEISPFNEYGRTKYEAEQVYKKWQRESPESRTLVIIRPTVIFGEQNRGNVYNLLRQIASGKFVMIGTGENRKSMAYVENVAAFIEHCFNCKPGIHTYNYIDKPDFNMNTLVSMVNSILGRPKKIKIHLPYWVGLMVGRLFDFFAAVTRRRLNISSIRVKKFCSNSVYNTAIDQTGFEAPVPIETAIRQTVRYEFIESHEGENVFYTE